MRDRIVMIVDDTPFYDFLSYSVDSDVLKAADEFTVTLIDDSNIIHAGKTVELWVNSTREFYGVIDRVESAVTKKGRMVQVSGLDIMGMLCSHDITEYGASTDLGGMSIAAIARTVMRDIPFINFMRDVVLEGKAANSAVPYVTLKAEPGQTAFDLLKAAATGRGLHFWCREDGKLVFGKTASTGLPVFAFRLDKEGGSNVTGGKRIEDLTESFSKIYVYGQSEDAASDDSNVEATASDDSNVEATATMSVPDEFPFYKPKVVKVDIDKLGPAAEARRLLSVSKAKMLTLSYTAPGHSQNGKIYRTNTMARVDDFINNTHGEYVVSGRTFSLENKTSGPMTSIRLSLPGAFDA